MSRVKHSSNREHICPGGERFFHYCIHSKLTLVFISFAITDMSCEAKFPCVAVLQYSHVCGLLHFSYFRRLLRPVSSRNGSGVKILGVLSMEFNLSCFHGLLEPGGKVIIYCPVFKS